MINAIKNLISYYWNFLFKLWNIHLKKKTNKTSSNVTEQVSVS